MKDRLLRALARLASRDYQEAFIVRATKDEYVLPEDLMEDVASLCSQAIKSKHEYLPQEVAALGEMLQAVQQRGPRIASNANAIEAVNLVREDEDWTRLRQEAGLCLRAFGLDIGSVRIDQVDEVGRKLGE